MEEQNNQNFEEQKIEQPKIEESKETISAPTTLKKPLPKMVIVIVAVAVVVVAVLLTILLGGNKDSNITCESCGASISKSVKFCPSCGNQATNTPSSTCAHDWEWDSATVTCSKDGYIVYKCLKCGGTKQENKTAYGCYDYDNDGYCNDCNAYIGNTASAEWISNRSISYQDDFNAYRFCFALQDSSKTYIACDATIKMSIVNDLGETVYQGTKSVKTSDYGEWYNIYDEWLGTAVYIYANELTAGLSDKGTFYYKVITEDNWFEYSLSIYDLPTYTPSYNVGEKWIVDDKFEFTINNVEHHLVCTKKHESSANITTGAAVIINYTYKNLGNYKLTIDKWNFEVYDSSGIEGDSLYFCIWCDHGIDANSCIAGGSCTAKLPVALINDGDFVTIYVTVDGYEGVFKIDLANHTHSFGDWNITEPATCTSNGIKERECSCGQKETQTVSQLSHSYVNGKCSCGAVDPNFKTPDLILGEYVQKNGVKQSNGEYQVSWQDGQKTIHIIWNPITKQLIFASEFLTSTGYTLSGIIYEHGAEKQKITVITQLSTGDKFTEIGYIYPANYKNDTKTIYSYVNDVPYADLLSSMKKSAESSIYMLVWDIDKWLEKNTDLEILDFGFTDWVL